MCTADTAAFFSLFFLCLTEWTLKVKGYCIIQHNYNNYLPGIKGSTSLIFSFDCLCAALCVHCMHSPTAKDSFITVFIAP